MLIRNKNGPPINTLNLLFSSNTDDIDIQNVIKTVGNANVDQNTKVNNNNLSMTRIHSIIFIIVSDIHPKI